MMGARIALLRPGGRLAQYDTPDAILAAPADEFVASFVGADRGLKRLALTRLEELELGPLDGAVGPQVAAGTTLRDALSLMLTEGTRLVVVVDDEGRPRGTVTLETLSDRIAR
jgi:osmoprotectant transport system ATP-binding protein